MVPALHSFKQLLVSPAAFFDERAPADTLPIAAGVVFVFALALFVGVMFVGSMLAGAIDATVTMDNPDRLPEHLCDSDFDSPELTADGCDEPETIERDAGDLVQEAVSDYLWIALVGPFVLWVVAGGMLYGAGRFAGGSPSFLGTLSLAGWAAVPELFRVAVGLAGLRVALANVTITDLESAVTVLEGAMAPVEPFLLVASLFTAGWQWYLLTGGLSQEADISRRAAAVGVGIPLGLFTLVTLL